MIEIRSLSSPSSEVDPFFFQNNLFGTEAWCSAHGDKCSIFGIFQKGECVGIFCLYIYTRLGKRFVITPPNAPHCGLKLRLRAEKPHSLQGEIKRIMAALAQFFKSTFKGAYLDVVMPESIVDMQAFQGTGYHVSPAYTYLLDLSPEPEHLFNEMSSARRKNIRDAQKSGFSLRWDGDSKELLLLIGAGLKRSGVASHSELHSKLLNDRREGFRSLSVSRDDTLLAAAICALDGEVAYYFAGGHLAGANESNAGALALWELILMARDSACRKFDFMGSSVPGIERFFRGFGAELTPRFRVHSDPGLIGWLQKQKQKLSAGK